MRKGLNEMQHDIIIRKTAKIEALRGENAHLKECLNAMSGVIDVLQRKVQKLAAK